MSVFSKKKHAILSAFSKKNMIFCPLFPRKYAAKVQQKMHIRKQSRRISSKKEIFFYYKAKYAYYARIK